MVRWQRLLKARGRCSQGKRVGHREDRLKSPRHGLLPGAKAGREVSVRETWMTRR